GGRRGPISRATSAALRPGVHCVGQEATRASRGESTTTRGNGSLVTSSAFGKSSAAAISHRPWGSISWVSPTARGRVRLVEYDRGAPTSVAAALDLHVS